MRKTTLVVGAVAAMTMLAGGWALAHSVGPDNFGPPFMHGKGFDGMGPGMMKGHGMMKGMEHGMGPGMMHGSRGLTFADPARIDGLKAELAITPAQEPAWSKYVRAVHDAAAMMKSTRESIDPNVVGKMTPPDRFAFVTKMREQGHKQFGAVKTAAEELLATLDAIQKAKANDILPGLAFGPGSMRGAFAGDQQWTR